MSKPENTSEGFTADDYRSVLSEARDYIRLLKGGEYSVVVDNIETALAATRIFLPSDPPPSQHLRGAAEDHNAAFDAANEALGGAFMAGFREGWIYAEIDADGERYQEMAEEYAMAVDSAPQEAWDAHRAGFFAMLPLSAIPEGSKNG